MAERRGCGPDLTYSEWHRVPSISRFISRHDAYSLVCFDIDCTYWIEYGPVEHDGAFHNEPLFLAETKKNGFHPEFAQVVHDQEDVLRNLSSRCTPVTPAYLIAYVPAKTPNPANAAWPDIQEFYMKRLFPCPQEKMQSFQPAAFAVQLVAMRQHAIWHLAEYYGSARPREKPMDCLCYCLKRGA
jgi:hypothetical protein